MPEEKELTVVNFDNVMRFLKEFGLPVAIAIVVMFGMWLWANEDRQRAREQQDKHDAQTVEYQKTLVELSTKSTVALDKVGDATEDVSKGLSEVKEQGEKIEAAFNRLTEAIEKSQ